MAGQRAVLRLLLFLTVATGIAGMHTLGHPSPSGHGGHGGAPAQIATRESPAAHVAMATATVAGSVSDAALVGVGRSLDPSTVCLAVLVAFGLAALLAALVVVARRTPPLGRYLHKIPSQTGRGPPATLLGLRLANLSVLRT